MNQPNEFLFDAFATTALPCGNREVTAKPVKVKLAAPKKLPPVRRALTTDEMTAVKCLKGVTTPPACWDKRFIRDVGVGDTITDKEAAQVWRLFHKYRRQITCAGKQRLLEVAAACAAPDLRKLAAAERERQMVQEHNERLKAVEAGAA